MISFIDFTLFKNTVQLKYTVEVVNVHNKVIHFTKSLNYKTCQSFETYSKGSSVVRLNCTLNIPKFNKRTLLVYV